MPDLSDISKGNIRRGKMGGSASRSGDRFSKNPYHHGDQEQFSVDEKQALSLERPNRPTPPNRPLPVLSNSSSEPRDSSSKSKDYSKPLDQTSSAASSPGMSQRKHTPATIPRTKFTSATPLEQRIAINNLRQKLDYEETEQLESNRGPSVKEVEVQGRGEIGTSAIYDEKASVSSVTDSQAASQMESEISDVVDTTRIMQRLTQVQDYLKQATSLYINLSAKVDLEDSEMDHLDKLGKLIQQLRLQEQGYVDLLQRTLDVDESADLTPSSSVLSLRQDEAQTEDSQQQQHQELKKLQMQHALLKKIVDQQQQIQDLKRKQATLASLQEQAEDLMRSADDARGEALSINWSEENRRASDANETAQCITTETCPHDDIDNEESALFDADMVQRRLELESKLMNLQAKKAKMDSLLSTLKASRDTIVGASNPQPASMPNMQKPENGQLESELELLQSKRAAIQQQQQSANQAIQQAMDVQTKLQKLKDVKRRLEDLTHIVSEYEQSHIQPVLSPNATLRSSESQMPQIQLQGGYGGARPRDDGTSIHPHDDRNSRDMTNGLDNRMRPNPPGGRSQRTAIDVTRNPSSRDVKSPSNVKETAVSVGKNLATEDQDNDLTSKIKQLQEARQRLAFIQRNSQLLELQAEKGYQQAKLEANVSSAKETETESESDSVSTAEDLSWQEDPEFQAKVRRLNQAKEKLKHLQELVNSVQQDGLVMDELANISVSSKESSVKGENSDKDGNEEEADETDEEDELTSEQQSDQEDNDGATNSAVEEEKIDDAASKQSDGSTLDNAVVMLDREMEYQAKLKQQKQELEKLLIEKQKLMDAQRQLSEIARSTLAADEKLAESEVKKMESSSKDVKKQPAIKFDDGRSEEKLPLKSAIVGKGGNGVKYEGLQVPRIVKRTSNLSVEPQYGSDSDLRIFGKKNFLQAKKRQAGFNVGSRPNPLVMSELRRQREMFEQNKKLKFVEKQRRKRDSGDDNRSDGGTYSIRSDLDEGVGHSMFSADVTTAATWGGSTEQSSSEEDSAVGEEDFPEEVEIDDEYEGNMDQPEEEEEEEEEEGEGRIEEEIEGDGIAPLLDFKRKRGKQKKDKMWFRSRDRGDSQRGKKRKLESGRSRSTVSWSMNVSPNSSTRQRQMNLTPAHKLMRERPSRRPDTTDSALWEAQCDQLRQQLASSTSLSTSLLRNQQTLLSMLQNQNSPFGAVGGSGFYFDGQFARDPMGSGLGYQRNTSQQQQQQHILQALERCTNQLDRQHQEIQSLQREFQKLLLRQSFVSDGSNRVYAWDHQTSPHGHYDQRQIFDMDGHFKNESPFVSSFKPDVIHAATSPHIFSDETRSRFTQTEAASNQTLTHAQHPGVDGVSGQHIATSASFLPFKFNDFRQGNEKSATAATPADDDQLAITKQSNSGYNPLIYTDSELASVKKDTENRSRDVITTLYPTPSKSKAAKNLAQRQRATWPSFLKESENIDSQSERSTSYYGEADKQDVNDDELKKEVKETDDKLDRLSVASNFSLFETMRDSIYSEVATLISMNESRPHYLVELFRELQLLTSDYLRQRALYALQDLVTRFLTEDSEMRQSNEPTEEVYRKWMGNAAIAQTPSESAATSDDERQEAKALEALSNQIRNNEMYDYAEIAESGSTMSTPTSNQDPPFAAEGLGDTVINLDEALQKMRSYEERMAEARKRALNENDCSLSIEGDEAIEAEASNVAASENSSAYDVASETSSELQQPSIDTQKLDRQIKSVMMDLIPFFNEHIESHCSPKFLSELNALIFKLAKQKEPGAEKQEFGRSFHRQLESVLKDSLSRFEGRSLKECGEDILINVSEILFNELAFFRLMQDLDRPMPMLSRSFFNMEAGSVSEPRTLPGQAQLSAPAMSPPAPRTHGNGPEQNRVFEDVLEIEDVKDEDNGSDAEDEIEASRQFVNVELSVSESRPVASTGSGEEDIDEDQHSFPIQNIPPESSVGAQQQQQLQQQYSQQQHSQQQRLLEEQNEGSLSAADGDDDVDVNDMPEDDGLRNVPIHEAAFSRDDENESELDEDERGEDEREEDVRDQSNTLDHMSGTEEGVARDTGNEDGDESEVTIDDLPTKLTGLTEADLQTRMQSEQSAVEGAVGILSHLSSEQELADDSALQQEQQQQPLLTHEQPSSQQQQEQYDSSAARKENE